MTKRVRATVRLATIVAFGVLSAGVEPAYATYSEVDESPDPTCSGLDGYTEENPAQMGDIAWVRGSYPTEKVICTINGWKTYDGD